MHDAYATLARLIMPTTVAERRLDKRLRRIRQFSAPDEGAKCRVAGITDCSNHFARLRRSVWSILEVTSGAQQRFEQADWHAVQRR